MGRNTRKELQLAIRRIERGRPMRVERTRAKLNITIVAREAGISPASIHNNYPDVAEQIRKKMNKSSRAQRDAKHEALQKAKRSSEALRQRLRELEHDLARLASENARLLSENLHFQGIAASPNVVPIDPQRR